jgi:hypothetical protein
MLAGDRTAAVEDLEPGKERRLDPVAARISSPMSSFKASSGSARTSTRNASSIADPKLPMNVNLNAGYDSFRCPERETQSVDNKAAAQNCGCN